MPNTLILTQNTTETQPNSQPIANLLALPVHGVQLEITSTCNFKCQFCPVSEQGKGLPEPNQKYASDEMVRKIIDTAENFPLSYFTFSFIGEPMMHPRVFEFIKYARSKNLPVLLVSNGTLYQEKHFDLINDSDLRRMKISLQVADKETFGTIRGVKMQYDMYLKKITRVLKARMEGRIKPTIYIDIGFNPTYTWANRLFGTYSGDKFIEKNAKRLARDIHGYLKYLTDNGITHEYANLTTRDIEKRIDIYFKEKGAALDERVFLQIHEGIIISLKSFWDHFGHVNNQPTHRVVCKPNKMVIDIDGDVTVCNRDINKKTVVANVYKNDMKYVLEQVGKSIREVSSGNPRFHHCYYCKGCPTKRGTVLRKVFDRPGW